MTHYSCLTVIIIKSSGIANYAMTQHMDGLEKRSSQQKQIDTR